MLAADGSFYFLEVNTRLQVEHPVTEAITGLDLVRMQIEVARGGALPEQKDVPPASGHAIEVRLYAEDPTKKFLPAAGPIDVWEFDAVEGVRVDSGVESGSVVTPYYDPMLAKVIAWAPTRERAAERLARALATARLGGRNNRALSCGSCATRPSWPATPTPTSSSGTTRWSWAGRSSPRSSARRRSPRPGFR